MARAANEQGHKSVVILGAAGRDFHNFNVYYRDNANYRVVAFTATQIPDIEGRVYPASLAGDLYPNGIPILPESDLQSIITEYDVDEVVFAYSDISHEQVMHLASLALASGADFRLLGPQNTMLKAKVPVVAVTSVRTGAGKSQTTRRVAEVLTQQGFNVVVVRHPMPYGDIEKQRVQRFATYEDLAYHQCTIEEREEYEPHIDRGNVVYAGVDYQEILLQAEKEADVILWDGGNNDFSFYEADLTITVVDPHRPGHEVRYHPGETNLHLADVIVLNKIDTATEEQIATVRGSIAKHNPQAKLIEAASPVTLSDPELVRNKRVVIIEDGPTLTHGDMAFGAGTIAAEQIGAQAVDVRPYAEGSLREVFEQYKHLGDVLPAMGYGEEQMAELAATVNNTPAEAVIIGTPIDLGRIMDLNKPAVRVGYDLAERGEHTIESVLREINYLRTK